MMYILSYININVIMNLSLNESFFITSVYQKINSIMDLPFDSDML